MSMTTCCSHIHMYTQNLQISVSLAGRHAPCMHSAGCHSSAPPGTSRHMPNNRIFENLLRGYISLDRFAGLRAAQLCAILTSARTVYIGRVRPGLPATIAPANPSPQAMSKHSSIPIIENAPPKSNHTAHNAKKHRQHHCPHCRASLNPRCLEKGHYTICELHPFHGTDARRGFGRGCLACLAAQKWAEIRNKGS